MNERYLYSLEITFHDTSDAEQFYEETLSFLEWLSENFGIESEFPEFYGQIFQLDEVSEDLTEEIEQWQEGLPLLECDLSTVFLKIYTEPFGSFLSFIAEDLGASDVVLQENILDEDDFDILAFGDDEYLEDSNNGLSEEQFDF